MIDQDQKTIEEIRAGQVRRFGALVERHKDRALTLAVRLLGERGEAEELVQDAFVRAYRNLDQFRGEAKFGTWFYRILYNLCMTRVTRRKPRLERLDEINEHELDTSGFGNEEMHALERLEEKELQEIITGEIHNLPERYRIAVTLFYVQEMNYEEIGAVLGLPVGTVKTNLFRARNLLRSRVLEKTNDQVKVA